MPETSGAFIPLESLADRGFESEVQILIEAVSDVARRLNHNVLAPEHLLVVGAENGVEEMARTVPSLTAFREALLDSLFDDREVFRYEPEAGEERLFLKSELLSLLDRIQGGEDLRELLAQVMLDGSPRIQKALAYARGTEPDVQPPDTVVLERALQAQGGEDEGRPAPEGTSAVVQLPLTVNLGVDASDDPPLVGRDDLADQVARTLTRFQQPSVLLVGKAGSGKTAFVRGLARSAATGAFATLHGFTFHQLKLLELVAQSHRGQDVHGLVDQIVATLADDPTSVLVVDDLHLLVAKQGYPLMSDLLDTVKLHVSRGRVRALLTVDSDAYEQSFGGDAFFGNQITVKALPPCERDVLTQIANVYRPRLEKHFGLRMDDGALEAAVTETLSREDADYVPPGSTIRVLDEACAMARAEQSEVVMADHVTRCCTERPAGDDYMDRTRLKDLERRLSEIVLGQELAAAAVARRVRLAKLHLDRKPHRPDGVFLFLGPSGVGKTEMAKGLSRALYDDESRLVRLDMSEYMEPHSVARIIGAPPGYVGYGEGGALAGPVEQLGHCVVLLDEIEKAHPRVLNLFLQVFDDGRLTDSKGHLVSFSDTVIIMTSNIGRELYDIHTGPAIGFAGRPSPTDEPRDHPLRDAVQEHLLRVLSSEFVNRIDEIVPFRVLDDEDIERIARKLLESEVRRWEARGKKIVYTDEVPRMIALAGYDPRLGARHVERNLERLVISLISDAAVTERFEAVETLTLLVDGGTICLELDGERFVCLTREGHPT